MNSSTFWVVPNWAKWFLNFQQLKFEMFALYKWIKTVYKIKRKIICIFINSVSVVIVSSIKTDRMLSFRSTKDAYKTMLTVYTMCSVCTSMKCFYVCFYVWICIVNHSITILTFIWYEFSLVFGSMLKIEKSIRLEKIPLQPDVDL